MVSKNPTKIVLGQSRPISITPSAGGSRNQLLAQVLLHQGVGLVEHDVRERRRQAAPLPQQPLHQFLLVRKALEHAITVGGLEKQPVPLLGHGVMARVHLEGTVVIINVIPHGVKDIQIGGLAGSNASVAPSSTGINMS